MSMTTDKPTGSGEHHDDGSYWHSKRTMAAGIVLVLVAVAAGWAQAPGGDDKPATETATTAGAYESACGLTGGSTATPTTGPEVQWQNLDGNWLPVSSTAGPGVRENGGIRSCYAHTPTGAVIAAFTIPATLGTADDFAAVVREQTVPGVGQLAMLKNGRSASTTNTTASPVGFVLNSYDGTTATVTMYMSAQSGARSFKARCTATVQWLADDWVLRPTSDGGLMPSCEQAPNDLLDVPHFVAWGPNT